VHAQVFKIKEQDFIHRHSSQYTPYSHIHFIFAHVLSQHQAIDKVCQLFGCGLVSEDNWLMKSLNHDMCHFSRHNRDVKKMADDKDADAFMLLYFLTAKQHKKRTIRVRRRLLDR